MLQVGRKFFVSGLSRQAPGHAVAPSFLRNSFARKAILFPISPPAVLHFSKTCEVFEINPAILSFEFFVLLMCKNSPPVHPFFFKPPLSWYSFFLGRVEKKT